MAEDLKLNANSKSFVYAKLSELIDTSGKSYRVTVKEWREKRSISQNNLVHKWFGHISDYLILKGREGCSEGWVKDAMKHTFLGYEMKTKVNVLTGEKTTVSELKHTSELDVGDMTHFMNKVYKWAMDIGCLLPIPEDSEYAQLMRRQEG